MKPANGRQYFQRFAEGVLPAQTGQPLQSADGNFCARCLCGHIDCPIGHNFSYVVGAAPKWTNYTLTYWK